jgi:hypothetical protein
MLVGYGDRTGNQGFRLNESETRENLPEALRVGHLKGLTATFPFDAFFFIIENLAEHSYHSPLASDGSQTPLEKLCVQEQFYLVRSP